MDIGDKIPPFLVTDHKGFKLNDQNIIGGPVVIYFYPKDNTPGCTNEACAFQKHLGEFDKMGILLLGVSPDDGKSHKKFIKDHELQFTLLSDPEKLMCEAFEVLDGEKVVRSTFAFDRFGNLQWKEQPVKVDGHVERVLEACKGSLMAPVYHYRNFLEDYEEFFEGKKPKIKDSEELKKEIKSKFGIKKKK